MSSQYWCLFIVRGKLRFSWFFICQVILDCILQYYILRPWVLLKFYGGGSFLCFSRQLNLLGSACRLQPAFCGLWSQCQYGFQSLPHFAIWICPVCTLPIGQFEIDDYLFLYSVLKVFGLLFRKKYMPCSALEWAQEFMSNFLESPFWVPSTQRFPLYSLLPRGSPFSPLARKPCLLSLLLVIVPTSRDKWWEHRGKRRLGQGFAPPSWNHSFWDWRERFPCLRLLGTGGPCCYCQEIPFPAQARTRGLLLEHCLQWRPSRFPLVQVAGYERETVSPAWFRDALHLVFFLTLPAPIYSSEFLNSCSIRSV